MRTASSSFVARWALLLTLVVCMVARAGPVHSQRPQPGPTLDATFLELRIHQAGLCPRLPQAMSPESASIALGSIRWKIETVDPGMGEYDGRISLQLDRAGHPHIIYGQGYVGLKYAHFDGQAWQTEIVAPGQDRVEVTSLALDTAGAPHIAYAGYEGLRYGHRVGSEWQFETVDSHAATGMSFTVSLALDRTGHPHIAYCDILRASVYYAYRDGASWRISTVFSGLGAWGGFVSLALDSHDRPAIGFAVGGPPEVRLARFDGISWRSELVASDMAGDVSFKFDSADRPHLAYSHQIDSGLHYAVFEGGAWHDTEVCRDGGPYHDLAVDSLGRAQVACLRRYLRDVLYAHSNGATWQIEVIQPYSHQGEPSIFHRISLALDSAGLPHVAYLAGTELRYAVAMTNLTAWSKLAFASMRDDNWEVYTAEGDGALPWRRTDHAAIDTTPVWDRGATRLAFVSDRNGKPQILTMRADGSNLTQLTRTNASELLPKWSPDGSRIAFYSSRDDSGSGTATNYEVYTMSAWGAGQERLTFTPTFDGHPAWSPDGTQIAFVSDRSGYYELWLMNADGSRQRPLGSGLNFASYPGWSPDGNWIAFNDDVNNDGWLDLALIHPDGTGLTHPIGESPATYDYMAPCWSPDSRNLAFTKICWIQYEGRWYWVYAYIVGLELETHISFELTSSGTDWWPSWVSTDVTPPSSRVLPLPALTEALTVTMHWAGRDVGPSGLRSYDVQYRDGASAAWTDWQQDVTHTLAEFSGEYGHTYYFRSRARDWANNVETYPEGDGDASIGIYRYTLSGRVLNIRDQPVPGAQVRAVPSAMNVAFSDWRGAFMLYFGDAITCSLGVASYWFSSPPLMNDIGIPLTLSSPTLYLRPANDFASNGDFESGSLFGWRTSGAVTLTHAAHTGNWAAMLGPGHSHIEQSLVFAPGLSYPSSLSVLYRAASADPATNALRVSIIRPTETYSVTVALTAASWQRAWCDAPAQLGPEVTLRIELLQSDPATPASVVIDEVSLGEVLSWPYAVFLPTISKAAP